MTNDPSDLQRRTMMQMAAGLAAASQLGANTAMAAAIKPVATGKSGDFDFLTGNWKIKNRRLVDKKWDEFEGESTVVGMLAGIAAWKSYASPRGNSVVWDCGCSMWRKNYGPIIR